ncbi:MAG TPA: zinc ribbon domain-containing protein [Vicinamibacterales bacterium]|nr:zinc ribbon domain-containing protein [Vicinamibacterales bacterium]
MNCRHCGTEIADKALICYKCGAATTDPVHQPPSSARPRSRAAFIVTFLALLVLAGVAVVLARSSPNGTPPVVTYVVAGAAVVIVALRAYARRR